MDMKRGFWRLWLISTVLIVTIVFSVNYGTIEKEFDKQAMFQELIADGSVGVPVLCADARKRQMGKEKIIFKAPGGRESCYYPFSKVRAFWPEYNNRADIDLVEELFHEAGDYIFRGQPLMAALRLLALGLALPLVALAFGWAAAGFAGASRKPS